MSPVLLLPGGTKPPTTNPAVVTPIGLAIPKALPVLISVISVQELPFHCSTFVLYGDPPPAAIAAVDIPIGDLA